MSVLSRFANLFRRDDVDRELDDEQRFHLESRIDALMADGLSRDAARGEALRRFGRRLQTREASRSVKLIPWLESLLRDVRVGLRLLRRDAVVTLAALTSLSLALGASIAAFTLVDALILRPLPVREPSRLVYLTIPSPTEGRPDIEAFNYPLLERLRAAAGDRIALFAASYGNDRSITVEGGDAEEKVRMQYVSGNAFGVLGVRPAAGRLLGPTDDLVPEGHPVAVLSHAYWMRRFGGDPAAIGRSFQFAGVSYQIVGVSEPAFRGLEPGRPIDLWAPTMMWSAEALRSASWSWFRTFGRLADGVSADGARAVLQPAFSRFRAERAAGFRPDEPRDLVRRYVEAPLRVRSAASGASALRAQFERPLWILAAIVGLVLLIAVTNLANLMSARGAAREREMSLRLSLGAARRHLVQQVLVEGLLLATGACALGLLFARAAAPLVVDMLSTVDAPVLLDLGVDRRVLAFTLITGALTAILFAIRPALRASGASPLRALQRVGGRTTLRAATLRPLLALQVGFSVVVLFVAGLLMTSFVRLTRSDLGFDKTNVVLVAVRSTTVPSTPTPLATQREILARARALPGVTRAASSAWTLFGGSQWTASVRVPGQAPVALESNYLGVSEGFFDTLAIRRLSGRDLQPQDAVPAQPTAVLVNESFARIYFGGASPLGRTFERVDREGLVRQEVVGVVADAKFNNVREPAPPTVYVPLRTLGTLALRTDADAGSIAGAMRRELKSIDPTLAVAGVWRQETLVDDTMLRERLLALLSSFFGAVGLLLACVGLFGVLSFSLVQRTREIGVRVALGASRFEVAKSMLRDVVPMTAAGTLAGLAGGLLLARSVTSLLYGVTPWDVSSLALPLAALLAAAAAAALGPLLRATRVDPVVALRDE